jgi:pimeloyl-ACP methyl ester carboxylesterase
MRMRAGPMMQRLAVALCVLVGGGEACARAVAPSSPLPAERPLPPVPLQGHVERDGARIWYGALGAGSPVILLHGGMSSSRAWGEQVSPLVAAGHRVILIDSRGHGRSTLGDGPLSYERMADDVLAVMNQLKLDKPAIVGWSDGGIIALVLAMRRGDRLSRVYAFGANMDLQGVRSNAADAPILKQVAPRLIADHAALSPTPDGFAQLHQAVRAMQRSQPDYSASQLASLRGPAVMIAGGAEDEFVTAEHQAYLARVIPGAQLRLLAGSGHFAPWQQPDVFNREVIAFLGGRGPASQPK